MTESEWYASRRIVPMLALLRGKASDRKLRLFACACCRRLWRYFPERRSENVVLVAERFADSQASREELKVALHAVWAVAEYAAMFLATVVDDGAAFLDNEVDLPLPWKSAWEAAETADDAEAAWRAECSAQCALLRDIFGDPFRPSVLDPSWLAWRDGAVRKMAQSIYDERRFTDLPIFADALEDAGCADAALLAHCREPGEHVRGCWVVDLLLGKA